MLRSLLFSLSIVVALVVSMAVAWSPEEDAVERSSQRPAIHAREARTAFDRGDRTLAESLKVYTHNLANAVTTAYKARYVAAEAVSLEEGGGIRHVVRTDFRQGDLVDTGRPLDWAIFGRGFFQVTRDDGMIVYTRRGDLALNINSQLVLYVDDREFSIEPSIMIPPDALALHVDHEGSVSVEQPGQCERSQVGQLQLAMFVAVDGLRDEGGGIFTATETAGPATLTGPDMHGAGRIRQGCLEASNVDVQRTIEEHAALVDLRDRIHALRTE